MVTLLLVATSVMGHMSLGQVSLTLSCPSQGQCQQAMGQSEP